MASTRKKSGKKFTKKKKSPLQNAERADWFKWASRLILGSMVTGIGFAAVNGYSSINNRSHVQANKIVALESKTEALGKESDSMKTQMNQIHWFLIKKPKVEVPAGLK